MTDSWLLCGSFNFLPVCFIRLPTPTFWWSCVYCSHQSQCVLLKGFFLHWFILLEGTLCMWRSEDNKSLDHLSLGGGTLFFSLFVPCCFSLCTIWVSGWNSSCQSWQKSPLAAKQSCWPQFIFHQCEEYKAKVPLRLSQDHYCLCDSFLHVFSHVYAHIYTFTLHF